MKGAGWALRAALGAGVLAACGTPADRSGNGLVFDRDVRSAYALVRDCRFPGEHSALGAYTVWISKDAEAAFRGLWAEPPTAARLPDGAVVVKEVYAGTECNPDDVDHWVAMRKEKGFDPAHADWHWQEVTAAGKVTGDGADPACISCHEGRDDATCIGYGEANGLDYLCTAP